MILSHLTVTCDRQENEKSTPFFRTNHSLSGHHIPNRICHVSIMTINIAKNDEKQLSVDILVFGN